MFPAWTVCVYMSVLCACAVLNVYYREHHSTEYPHSSYKSLSQVAYDFTTVQLESWRAYGHLMNRAKKLLCLCPSGAVCMWVHILALAQPLFYGGSWAQSVFTYITDQHKNFLRPCNFSILKLDFLIKQCLKGVVRWRSMEGFFGCWKYY